MKKNKNIIIKFNIWDTEGKEIYIRALAPIYYRNVNTAFVVYVTTTVNSLLNVKSWVNELKKKKKEETVLLIVTMSFI